jgi:lysophospholipase L1-like esterase
MKKTIRRTALPLLTAALALGVGGCIEDETIILPDQTSAQRMFLRYVSMGNSLTAGWMSAGINDSTQHRAYPVLLAAMADVDFGVPSLAMPGCPPPLVGVVDTDTGGNVILEEDRVSGGTDTQCGLRALPAPPVVQNVAVPGAKIADAIDIDRAGNASNALTTLINGGLSQVEAMRRARPTFVTSWLGNNDALGAALEGDTTLLTPIDSFSTYHERVAQGISGSGALGAALIGVVDPTIAPLLQPGLYYWLADSLGYAPKEVDWNCAPTDSAGTLNPLSMNTVLWNVFRDTAVAVVSCDPSAPYVLTPAERLGVSSRADAFNDVIQAEAQQRDWVYLDATGLIEDVLSFAGNGQHDMLRRCVGLSNTQTEENMVAFFETRCPNPSAPNYFGSLVTFDGIHMSAAAHSILATELADLIDSRYDVTF